MMLCRIYLTGAILSFFVFRFVTTVSPTLARLQDHPDEEPDAEADETETTSDEDDDASSCSSSSCSSSSYASDEFDDSDVDLSEFSGDVEDEELEKEMAMLLRKLG